MITDQIHEALSIDNYDDKIATLKHIYATNLNNASSDELYDVALELSKFNEYIYNLIQEGEREHPTKYVKSLGTLLRYMIYVTNETKKKKAKLIKNGRMIGPDSKYYFDVLNALDVYKLLGTLGDVYDDRYIEGNNINTLKGLREALKTTDGSLSDIIKLYSMRSRDRGVRFNKLLNDYFEKFIEEKELKKVNNDPLKTIASYINAQKADLKGYDIISVEISGAGVSDDSITLTDVTGTGDRFRDKLGIQLDYVNDAHFEGEDLDEAIKQALRQEARLPEFADVSYTVVRKTKEEAHGMESGTCLRDAIRKITGVEYPYDTLEEIPDFIDATGIPFNIYNNYGAPLENIYKRKKDDKPNNYDLIVYSVGEYKHALALETGAIGHDQRTYEEEPKNLSIEDIEQVYKVVYDNMLLYKGNSHRFGATFNSAENIKIYVYANDYSRQFLPYAPDNDGWCKYSHTRKNDDMALYFAQMTEEHDVIYYHILEAINNTKCDFSSFPPNYRHRCGYVRFTPGVYYEADIKGAYKNAFMRAVSAEMINIYNQPITCPRGEWFDSHKFIFYVYGCKYLPCGYYYGQRWELFQQLEPNATYEVYKIRNYINNASFVGLIDEMKNADKKTYPVVIGMLINGVRGFHYSNNFKTYDVQDITFSTCKTCTVHLNVILAHNEELLKGVMWIRAEGGVWPCGYNIDAAYYHAGVPIPEKWEGRRKTKDYTFKSVCYTDNMDLLFGSAGCGKTTTIIENAPENTLFIVGTHQLKRLYESMNRKAVIFRQITLNHIFYQKSYIVVDECFTFSNEDISDILNIANYYDVGICFAGDYNQLPPIGAKSSVSLLEMCSCSYNTHNYRNKLDFAGSEKWLLDCVRAGGWVVNGHNYKHERDLLLKRYAAYIDAECKRTDVPVLRWHPSTTQRNAGRGDYWIINNVGNIVQDDKIISRLADKAPSKIRTYINANYSKDYLYTFEEIEPVIEYAVNTNLISFYNTQGQSMDCIRVINTKEFNDLIASPRMFYVLISRITEV